MENFYSWSGRYFDVRKLIVRYQCFIIDLLQITISTLDRRKSPLTFKASILDMDGRTLMDFRLSKGCGLEFKRCFIAFRKELNRIIVKGQVPWSCDS